MGEEAFNTATKIVHSISKEEYEDGNKTQAKDFHYSRLHPRFIIKDQCAVKSSLPVKNDGKMVTATTVDYSNGGICLKYGEEELPEGVKVKINIDALKISDKDAEVRWSVFHEGASYSGLKWI